jgi:hypothetical protein
MRSVFEERMSQETIALILSIVGSSGAAVWALRSKMSSLELALTKHIGEESAERKALETRVVKLEKRRR